MFIDEAKIAVQLNHANIAQIFDLGDVDGSYYIALEYVHGRDLRAMFDRCRNAGEPMPVALACFVIMKVCEGLDYAHNKRDQAGRELHLVHRDVSPQNILVSYEGEVKLIDFGIAKAAGKGSEDPGRHPQGQVRLHVAGAGPRPADRSAQRHLLVRHRALRAADRRAPVRRRERLLDAREGPQRRDPAAVDVQPQASPTSSSASCSRRSPRIADERYQNAIDLHDELQAFVYTAGEFYSRKDLAAWMKKTFAKEIDEETAKLESYRQLKAPASDAPAIPRTRRTAISTQRCSKARSSVSTDRAKAIGPEAAVSSR